MGSSRYITDTGYFQYKAKQAYNISLDATKYESENKEYSANIKWIYMEWNSKNSQEFKLESQLREVYGKIGILSGFLKCKCCGGNMIKRTSKEKVYYYCSNYYRNKTCENNESISENKLIEIINEKLNLSNINRLELENKVKCIYIDKNKNVKIDFK